MQGQTAPTETGGATQQTAEAPVVASFEERSASVFGTDAPAAEGTAAEAAPAAAPTDAEKLRTERAARLAKLQEDERRRVDAQQKHRESEEIRQKLAAAERRAQELEAERQRLVDVSSLDEDGLLSLLERGKADPVKLAERIRELMANPELAAAKAATKAVDPKLAALEKQLAEQKAMIDSFLQTNAKAQQERAEAEAAAQFNAHVEANAGAAPYAAAFLKHHGPEEFYRLALSASASVPPGAGWEAVLDVIEENLSGMAPVFAPPSASQRQQAPTSPNPAAAKATTTVSNTLAQGRASVVDEEADWASLPFEERSARLFR